MIFNKSKKQIYFLLKDFDKTNNFNKSLNNTQLKFKIDDYTLDFRINECVSNHFVDGIQSSSTDDNSYVIDFSEHIFITYNGYEFLKNYYGFIRKGIIQLLIIVITAIVTVLANNYLSNSNNCIDTINKIVTQDNN